MTTLFRFHSVILGLLKFVPSTNLFYLLIVLVLVSGCTVSLKPLTDLELEKITEIDQALMFPEKQRVFGEISFQEALARALKYNLDKRAKVMEQALALKQVDLDEYQLLPNLIAKGGYSDRSEFSASNSKERGDGPGPTSGYSYSGDRTIFKGDLTLSWNVLDFGLSYFNARQNADRALIVDERRRKVIHNLIREVQFSYWRMVAAQKLGGRVKVAVKRAEKALFDAETVEKEKLQTPTEILQYQKRLLQNIRKLETVNQQLSTAQVELAALINIPPGTNFRVVVPKTDALKIPRWSVPVEKMELLAFHKNPDIREKIYQDRITVGEVKKSLIQLLPGIDLSGARNSDSNSFQDVNRWFAWSSTLSINVLKLFSAPAQVLHNKAKKALAEAQRLAIRMAVIAQVHVAKKQYENAVNQYERADKMYRIDKRLSDQISKRQESDIGSMLGRISQETAAIDAELRRFETYSNMMSAVAQIHSTLGVSIIDDKMSTNDLPKLSQFVQKGLNDWLSGYAISTEVRQFEKFKAQKKLRMADIEKSSGFKVVSDWAKEILKDFRSRQKKTKTISSNFDYFTLKPKIGAPLLAGAQNLQGLTPVLRRGKGGVSVRSAAVSLNEVLAGGRLIVERLNCNIVTKLKAQKGWIKISAKNIKKERIEGWLHEVYFEKLKWQCQNNRLASRL